MHAVDVDHSIMIPPVEWKTPGLGVKVPLMHSKCDSPGSVYECDGWCREPWGRGAGGWSPVGNESPTVVSSLCMFVG